LTLAGLLRQIAGVALQRLILLLRRLVGHALRAAHALERRQQRGAVDTRRGEQLLRRRALLLHEAQQDVLGGDVSVAQRLRLVVRPIEHPRYLARQRRLGGRAGLLREERDLALG